MVALQPPELVARGLSIPHPDAVRNAFDLTSMFSSYSASNEDYAIFAIRTQAGRSGDRGRWIELPLSDHFPRRLPLTAMQIYASFPARIDGDEGRARAWSVLAEKIRANHNRLHPESPVAQIRLDAVQWPTDPRGFYAGKAPGKIRTRLFFSEALE